MRSMSQSERKETIAKIVAGLPEGAGSSLLSLSFDVPFCYQARKCEHCGTEFMPKDTKGLARFCGKSCSAHWRMSQPQYKAKVHNDSVREKIGKAKAAQLASGSESAKRQIERIRKLNPMANPEVRARVSSVLQAMKHKPQQRGGNGHGMTLPQSMMLEILGDGWAAEYALSLGKKKPGYPTCYKLDIACESRKINIEVDGTSHRSRKAIDQKRDAMLSSLGWTVIRFWNSDILNWIESGMPKDSIVAATLSDNGIKWKSY